MRQTRTKTLEQLIIKHKSLYYKGIPQISDQEFDLLEEELRKIDPNHYVLNLVGYLNEDFERVPHQTKMLSLNKTYDQEDLKKWIADQDVMGTYKVDGVSCSIIYQNGKLFLAKTRGDGSFGENITSKVLWIDSIPKEIDFDQKSFNIEIRGELYCDQESFNNLADEMESRKLDRPNNQRNIVAGLMGRKDHIDLCRYLDFFAYDVIIESSFSKFLKEEEKFSFLKKIMLKTPEYKLLKSSEEVCSFLSSVSSFIANGNYSIDGAVFTYNDLKLQQEKGETIHHPRYKMAYKWEGEIKSSIIEKISWQVSRNGVLTPVAEILPISLSGATISRVTLHNWGLVKEHRIKKNDKIKIIRSGEVIPKFLSVEVSSDEEFIFPKNCPSCGMEVVEIDIRLICKNNHCRDQIKESILHFVKNIGIDDLSDKRVESLIEKGLIKKIQDIYNLRYEDFLKLEKTKEKLASKILKSIEKSKETDLVTFLTALGISGGAQGKCEKIINSGYNSIEKIISLNRELLLLVDSFAEKSTEEFLNSLNEKKTLISDLINLGLKIKKVELLKENSLIKDKKFCITGALNMKRADLEKILKESGAIIQSSITKNSDFLVTNEKESTSSKFKMAKSLGIPIINEDDLMNMLKS